MFAELEACEQLAVRMADRARELVVKRYRSPLAVQTKDDRSPVSELDQQIERELRAMIQAAAPHHGIIGEEFDDHQPDAELIWVIDPIDGTKAFLAGIPTFVTLIGLLRAGRPVLGVIEQPVVRDRWIGGPARQTLHNGVPAIVRRCHDISQAWLASTSPSMFKGVDATRLGAVTARARQTVWGGDGFLYGLLASGHLDLVIENSLGLHDFAALVPIVTGAGGLMTDWFGRELGRDSAGDVVAASDQRLHAQALELLQG
ncbi:inositol monophosphatase family protein [Engelhardtia mirabilis]|uniref:Histidinol-phosphatase n=1 Tax=Engelhardtia mirabilis TaxID=2528011 RepID=A0A518BDB8_9BACT|nr:Histidinol-phosphatase [Planctomycetes bacterium Pla133]QDU99288.1 Histidinol-phosphatase [Planctomycetes bacterium Pla86]